MSQEWNRLPVDLDPSAMRKSVTNVQLLPSNLVLFLYDVRPLTAACIGGLSGGALSDVTVQKHFGTKRSVATLFRFVAYFGCVRIEDSSGNRFVLNGIQRIACFILFFYIVPETFCTVTSCTHEAIRYTL